MEITEELEKIVETTNRTRAESLMKKGYSLVGTRLVTRTEQHCPSHLSPSDWPDSYKVEDQLYILALNP
jgi:hypothetical protein